MINGDLITSGNDGSFLLKIPLGSHTVAASKVSITLKQTCSKFIEDVSGYQFLDTTTVKVIGFVVGGDVEGSKNPGSEKHKQYRKSKMN